MPLDAAILFAPVGDLVPGRARGARPGRHAGGRGHPPHDVPALDYQRHLFRERTLTSVTANTRADGEELLRWRPRLGVRAPVTPYPFAEADRALADLRAGAVAGAAVLTVG